MKIAIDVENQQEYNIVRDWLRQQGARPGFDSSPGKGFIYVLDTEDDSVDTLRVGCTKDIPEIKRQGYKYVKASEFFKDIIKKQVWHPGGKNEW